MNKKILFLSLLFLLIISMVNATTYYVSNSGNDSLSGTSEANAFQTINKSNSVSSTSDTVLFKCGDSWRIVSDSYFTAPTYGVLPILKSGTPTNRTNYDSYGCNATNNAKPLFLGSFNASFSSFWINKSNITNPCLWTTAENMSPDLGNSIFWEQNGTLHTGVRKQFVSQISQQGDWNYNETTNVYMMYSCQNPALYYSRIELAVKPSTQEMMFNLDNKANINIANLSLMFTGSSAINGENMVNITIADNNLWYVGGDWQQITRYGNCIDIQKSATNVQVLNNNISQCYDGAVTIEAYLSGGHADIKDVLIQGNVLAYSQYGVEYFSSNTTNTVTNVSIIGNTIPFNGYEWSHNERYGSGQILTSRAFRLANSPVNTTGFVIKDNLVYNARDYSEYLYAHSTWLANPPTQDYNDYWNDSGTVKFYYNGTDNVFNLSGLQSESGQEVHGLQVNPLFVNALSGDYRLQSSSPLCNASSSGSYVGALPCANAPPSISFVNPLNNSYVNARGFVVNLSVNSSLPSYTFLNYNNSLYAWWTFDNLNSTNVLDSSGNGFNLSYNSNTTFSTGVFGNSSNFMNTSHLSNPSVHFSNDSAYTVSFWFKWYNRSCPSASVCGGLYGEIKSNGVDGSGMYILDTGQIQFRVANTSSQNMYTNFFPTQGTWYYITLVRNESNYKFYVNDTLVKEQNMSITNMNVSTSVFSIASYGNSVNMRLNGSMDEFRIDKRAYSQREVSASYNSSSSYYNTFSENGAGVLSLIGYIVDSSGQVNSQSIFVNSLFADLLNPTPTANSNVSISFPQNLNIIANISVANLTNISVFINGVGGEVYANSPLWLEFDNNSYMGENDTTFKDYSTYNRSIVNNGLVYRNCGVYGGCVEGNGTGSYATVTNFNISALTNYTIYSTFTYPPEDSGSSTIQGALFSDLSTTCRNGTAFTFLDTYSAFYYPNATSCNSDYVSSKYKFDEGDKVDLVINNNDGNFSIYMNGLKMSSGLISSPIPNSYVSNLFLLTDGTGSGGKFSYNGNVSRFVVLNRAVNSEENKRIIRLSKTSDGYILNVSTKELIGVGYNNFSIVVNGVEQDVTFYRKDSIDVNVSLNFSKVNQTSKMNFGLQNEAHLSFITKPILSNIVGDLYHNSTSRDGYHRIWFRYRTNETPYVGDTVNMEVVDNVTCSVYNYTNLDRVIGWTLEHGMIPSVMSVNSPPCWVKVGASEGASADIVNSTYYYNYSNYLYNVIDRYKTVCDAGNLTYLNATNATKSISCGNFSKFQWGIYNEPSGDMKYLALLNYTYPYVKGLVSEATVGAAAFLYDTDSTATLFYDNLNSSAYPDRYNYHGYDDGCYFDSVVDNRSNIEDFLYRTKSRYYDEYSKIKNTIKSYRNDTLIYNDEYNTGGLCVSGSFYWNEFTANQVGAVWMVSALYNQILSGIDGEVFYWGMDNNQASAGLFNGSLSAQTITQYKPIFFSREAFVQSFYSGQNIYVGESSDGMIETIATDNKLMIINKYNATANVVLSTGGRSLVRLSSNGTDYDVSGGSVSLSVGALDYVLYDLTFGVDSFQRFSLFGSLTIYNKDFYIY